MKTPMTPAYFVEALKLSHPNLLNGVGEKAATRLLRLVFDELGAQIAATQEGVVPVPGLGRFRIRQINVEKDGQQLVRARVLFLPWPARVGKEQSETD